MTQRSDGAGRPRTRRPDRAPAAPADGFTLIEVMVAVTILAAVLLSFLATRSHAMADAIQARNWRLARSIAEEQLSKLQAGANEFKPEPMPVDVEGYPGFRYVVLIGQEAISNAEAEIDNMMADDMTTSDRRMWQRERDDLRMARQKGLSIDDYRRQTLERESDPNAVPSEDDLEEVAVIVYFPNATLDPDDPRREQTFILKAKVSTLAIHGLTPQQADGLAAQKGLTANNPSGGAGAAPGGKSDG